MKSLQKTVPPAVREIRASYRRDRSVFVAGARMAQILLELGADRADVERLRYVSDRLSSDPTLPFRRTRNGRFCLDFDNQRIYRMSPQPFVLSEQEDFVRHDSGRTRVFDEIDDDLQQNTAMQALLRFKALIVNDVAVVPRPGLDYSSDKWVCTVFSIRTVTVPGMLGEPALEGVHSDGVDHTMTTCLGSRNITADSAVTLLHDNAERNGVRWNATDPALRLGQHQHVDFLDTLLLVDHERKHSVSPVHAVNQSAEASRDMAIFFTRRPTIEGHISHPYDALTAHQKWPLSFSIPDEGK